MPRLNRVKEPGITPHFRSASNTERIADTRKWDRGRHVVKRSRMSPDEKPFIAWDGEGITHPGDRQQSYVLFGCSEMSYIVGRSLTTRQCLELILDVEEQNPDAIHVAFAFEYDVNMILKDLSREELTNFKKYGVVQWNEFRIEHIPRKWFTVSRGSKRTRTTARIFDVFTFYATSFANVAKKYLPNEYRSRMESGKQMRGDDLAGWVWDRMDDLIIPYWKDEILLMRQLVENLRELMLTEDIHLAMWHGPGAVASYFLNLHKVNVNMSRDIPDAVIDASAHAYAGGHFELFRVGHHAGTVYSYDINSAYPYALSHVPSLSDGEWEHITDFSTLSAMPKGDMAVYHIVRDNFASIEHIDFHSMQPLFYRDGNGNMHYPLIVDGWYWDPEAELVWGDPTVRFVEAYVYHANTDERPFSWVADIYERRKILKQQGNPSELALKLAINSLYGKLAQRVGWDQEKKLPPKWHQLEWAGWLTSYARAMLYRAGVEASKHNALIAVETDGIYTTMPLDLDIGTEWGQWKPETYGGITYVQNGVYWYLTDDGTWKHKYRGLDPKSIDHVRIMEWMDDPRTLNCSECMNNVSHMSFHNERMHLDEMTSDEWCPWCRDDADSIGRHTCDFNLHNIGDCDECSQQMESLKKHTCSYVATTKRFRGYGMALQLKDGLAGWRSWETTERLISPGGAASGKRRHVISQCRACNDGLKLSQGLHDMMITKPEGGASVAHYLPWRDVNYPTNENAVKDYEEYYRHGVIFDENTFSEADMQSRPLKFDVTAWL